MRLFTSCVPKKSKNLGDTMFVVLSLMRLLFLFLEKHTKSYLHHCVVITSSFIVLLSAFLSFTDEPTARHAMGCPKRKPQKKMFLS